MKNYTSIFVIMLLLLLGACNQDDELAPNGRVDLTRNTISSPRWMFVLPIVDSIYDGIPYYKPFPHYQANSGSRIVFGLKRLNVENSVYLRTTEYPDINGGPELYYCYDTICYEKTPEICLHAAAIAAGRVGRTAKQPWTGLRGVFCGLEVSMCQLVCERSAEACCVRSGGFRGLVAAAV